MKHFFTNRRSFALASTTVALLIGSMNLSATENSKGSSERQEIVAQAQVGRKITVKVSDAYGPVIGANVVVKGTTNGGITDIDGNVSLNNVSQGETIVISYIGYVTKEIPVGASSLITVELSEDAEALDEVVVVRVMVLQEKVT